MPSFSPRASSASSAKPNITKEHRLSGIPQFGPKFSPATRPAEEEDQHVLAVPFYNVSGDWSSTLMLSNQAPKQMQADISLFSLAGRRLVIPTVTLEPHKARIFDLAQWASSFELRKGSLQVSYFGPERVVAGTVKIVRANQSLIFDQQLTEPEEYFISSRLAGVWWLPSKQTAMSIAMSNTGDVPVSGDLTLYGPHGRQIGSKSISLSAHETQLFDAKQLIEKEDNALSERDERTLPQIGGVTINHTGAPGSVFASIMTQEAATGFSAIDELRDPQAAVSSKLNGAGLRIGRSSGEQLTQIVAARNVGSVDSILTGRIVYSMRDGRGGVITIPEVTLGPGQATAVDVAGAIQRKGVNEAYATGLEFEYSGAPGSVLVSAMSVSEDTNQVFRVPLIDAAGKTHPTNSGKYHLTIARNTSTLVYLKNVTNETQEFNVSIEIPGGSYVPGLKKIEPGRTLIYDLRELRDNQVPDEDGNKLPRNVESGYLSWSAHAAKNLQSGEMEQPVNHVMIGRVEQTDTAAGMSSTSSYGCGCQPSYADSWVERQMPNGSWSQLSNDPVSLYTGETVHLRARETDSDCGGWNTYTQTNAGWSTYDQAMATVDDSGVVTAGVLGGEATITAAWWAQIWYPLYDCCEYQSWDAYAQGGIQIKAPTRFVPVSVTQADLDCPTSPDYFRGYGAQVLYQVVDQDGNAYPRAGMTPLERFTQNGIWNSQVFTHFANPPTTNSSGQFLDIPIGTCHLTSPFSTDNPCASVHQAFQLSIPNTPGSPVSIPTVTDRQDCVFGIHVDITNSNTSSYTLGTVP